MPVPWRVDVHSHCDEISDLAYAAAEVVSDPKAREPKKDWITEGTFRLTRIKSMLLPMGRNAGRLRDRVIKSECFSCWRRKMFRYDARYDGAGLIRKEWNDWHARLDSLLDTVTRDTREILENVRRIGS